MSLYDGCVDTVCRHCAVCVGSYNIPAGECVVLLAYSDGSFQPSYHVGTQRNHSSVAWRSHAAEDNLLLSAVPEPQCQPPALLLHWAKVSS